MSNSRERRGIIKQRTAAFGYAIRGIIHLLRNEPNAWVHLVATIGVVVVGGLLGVTAVEWCLLALAIGFVWTAEAVNTAVERTVNLVSPEFDRRAGHAKDVAAGAVLLAALTAAIIGGIVLGPRLAGWGFAS